jgi:glutathione-regulated potassium-efflux system protein KefB
LFGSAQVLKVIDETTFISGIAVISLSMLATPLLVRLGDRLAARVERKSKMPQALTDPLLDGSQRRVLIGGYGRMGHTVATLLQASGIPYLAFDTDPARVAQGRADGEPVLYGDISDPELLAAAHAEQASLVVLTIDHGPTALRAVSHLRNTYPQVPVIARARDLVASSHLLQAGATQAYPESIEASLRLGAEALQMVGAPADSVDQLLQGVRERGYQIVRKDTQEGQSR